MSETLKEAIAAVALRLPAGRAAEVGAALRAAGHADAVVLEGAVTPAVRESADRIISAWRARPDAARGPGLALALEAAVLAAERERAAERLEVVWTGPTTHGVPVRLTKQVLLDVVGAARRRLLILSFAAYRVAAVIEALQEAGRRGVRTDVVLETAADAGGRLAFDIADSLGEIPGVYVWHWPAARRPVLETGHAALHAKAAVADDTLAFVTSANLTGHALAENIELGLLVRGGSAPEAIRRHVEALMAREVLCRLRVSPA